MPATSKSLTDIWIFPSNLYVFRHFIRNYSEVAKPYTATTIKKYLICAWICKYDISILSGNEGLTFAGIRVASDWKKYFLMYVNVSLFTVDGTIPLLNEYNYLCAVANFTKKILPAESNNLMSHPELISLLIMSKTFRCISEISSCILFTGSQF